MSTRDDDVAEEVVKQVTRIVKRGVKRGVRRIINRSKTRRAIQAQRRNRAAVRARKQRLAAGLPAGRRNLGPMGELGDDIIIQVDVTNAIQDLTNYKEFRVKDLDTEEKIFQSIWGNVYFPLQGFTTTQINALAPKMTEDLRKSMKKSIMVDKDGDFPLTMIINTAGIEYAKPVNKMPATWLIHPSATHPNVRRVGGKTYILNDPKAKKGFYDLTLLNSRNRARRLWKEYIKKYFVPIFRKLKPLIKQLTGRTINEFNEANKLFKVKFK